MQQYFFDIVWNDETVADEEGTGHFDDGSAIFYGRLVASRIARCGRGDTVHVHVRDSQGRLLTIARPAAGRTLLPSPPGVRTIVERDLRRQALAAG